jgi:hypothetical protein
MYIYWRVISRLYGKNKGDNSREVKVADPDFFPSPITSDQFLSEVDISSFLKSVYDFPSPLKFRYSAWTN